MEILVYEPTNKIQKLVVNSLIGIGLRPKAITNQSLIIPELTRKNYDLLLMECNLNRPDLVQIIQDIKADVNLKSQKIFLHTATKEKKFVFELLKFGINGVIFKPFQMESFKKQFLTAIERAKMEHSQRKHIRVTPDKEEKARATFRNPNTMKVLNGKIVDISLGGLAVTVDSPEDLTNITAQTVIHSTQLIIRSIRATCSLVVVTAKGNLIAFKYAAISNFDLTTLCDYIYEHIHRAPVANQAPPIEEKKDGEDLEKTEEAKDSNVVDSESKETNQKEALKTSSDG